LIGVTGAEQLEQSPVSAAVAPAAETRWARDPLLWLGLAVIALGAVALRLPALDHGLPLIIHPDEPTVVDRADLALAGQLAPPAFNWPPLSAYVAAAAFRVTELAAPEAVATEAGRVFVARLVSLKAGILLVVATGVLAAAATQRHRRASAWTAAAAMAVSYTAVRLSRIAHPEQLQTLLAVGALLAAIAYERRGRLGWLLAAGAFAGLAGATKYIGAGVVLVPLYLAVTRAGSPPAARLGQALALAASTVFGFVAGTLGTAVDVRHLLAGVRWQLEHQAQGHLGYEAVGNGVVFHLFTSMPGNWGWALTALAVSGLGWWLWRGSRAQRALALYAVLTLLVVGSSQVHFPHYVFVIYPVLAAAAASALVALATIGRPGLAGAAVAAALLLTAPTVLDGVQLLRAGAGPDTRERAAAVAAGLDARLVVEVYTGAGAHAERVTDAAGRTVTPDCDCVVVLSSYQEERYRRLPDLYRDEVAGYDALRARGSELAVIAPSVPLSYRWDVLPQWGLRELPLTGDITTGPTVTFLDLRQAAGT
jgi:hypothetical protein